MKAQRESVPLTASEIARPSFLSSWTDRLHRLTSRLIGDPRFQKWAAAFPLTRPFARRSANRLFDICAGFVYSQVLYASVRCGLFDALAEGPLAITDLARAIELPPEATRRLVDAATALGLTARRSGDRVGLGQLGAAMLGNPGIARMVEHHAMLYRDLADPLPLLRGEVKDTELSRYWAYARSSEPSALHERQVAAYSDLMAASQNMIAQEVLSAYSIRRHRGLLDAGGGQGAFISAAAEHAPDMRLMLFDLPPVAERARRYLAGRGLGDRVEVVGGNLFSDSIPTGCDLISLIRIVHDHDDEEALAILRAVHRALPADGTLLVAEPMARTRGSEAMGDAYFGFYLMAMGSGRPRSAQELSSLLEAAGFVQPRLIATHQPLLTRVMIAKASQS